MAEETPGGSPGPTGPGDGEGAWKGGVQPTVDGVRPGALAAIPRTLAIHEARVALAAAKRERGEPLTTVERRLLACEDRGITPEVLITILGRIAAHQDTEKNKIRASTKVEAVAKLFELRDGPDPEAPAKPASPGVVVNVGVGVQVGPRDPEVDAAARVLDENPDLKARIRAEMIEEARRRRNGGGH